MAVGGLIGGAASLEQWLSLSQVVISDCVDFNERCCFILGTV